jgi:hypothetical protein
MSCTVAKFELQLAGLRVKHAVQNGVWVAAQHLLWDRGKQWDNLTELTGRGPSGCELAPSQLSGIEYASPNISPYLCC